MFQKHSMSEIIIYQTPGKTTQVEVQFDKETVWLNRQQLSKLFDRDVKTIGKHINNVFSEGELDENRTVAKFVTVQKEGKREVEREVEYYNLDVIISVGYRVNSKRGTQFRQWATQRLKDFLVKGYAVNQKRLEELHQTIQFIQKSARNQTNLNETKGMLVAPALPVAQSNPAEKELMIQLITQLIRNSLS